MFKKKMQWVNALIKLQAFGNQTQIKTRDKTFDSITRDSSISINEDTVQKQNGNNVKEKYLRYPRERSSSPKSDSVKQKTDLEFNDLPKPSFCFLFCQKIGLINPKKGFKNPNQI